MWLESWSRAGPTSRLLMDDLDAGWAAEMWAYLADGPKRSASSHPRENRDFGTHPVEKTSPTSLR